MPRILLTSGPDDWQKLLAKPEKQWKSGYSARTLAHCWEAVDEFPPEVSKDAPKIARFPAATAVPYKLSLHPRAPRFSPGGSVRRTCIY